MRLALQGLQLLNLLTGGARLLVALTEREASKDACVQMLSLICSSDEAHRPRCSVLPLAGIGLPHP